MKKTRLNKIIKYIKDRKLILGVTLIFTIATLTLLLNRFWQYEVFYYDHGYTESAIYQSYKLQMPMWDREGKYYAFMDHFYPSLLLVYAPFYLISNSYLTSIVVFSLLIGISVLIGYEIGLLLKIEKFFIYTLLFAYTFFIGMQNAIIFFVKDITSAVPFLMLMLFAYIKKNKPLYFVLLIIVLGFKETLAVTIVAIGVYIFIFEKERRKDGIYTIAIGLIYGLIVSKFIIPYFIFKSYGITGAYMFAPSTGQSFSSYLTGFIDTAQKRETILVSFLNFGFLPLLNPFGIIMALQDFAQRFVLLAGTPLRTGLNLHYSASLSVFFFVSSLITIQKIQKKLNKKTQYFIAGAIVLTVLILHRFLYHGPFGLLYNPDFIKITKNMTFMDEFVNKIPHKGKIMVQNNIAVRFTHNDYYILSSEKYFNSVHPDVIVLDFRPGQNINNYWPMTEEKMQLLSEVIKKRSDYTPIFEEEYRYIFVKNNK